VEGQCLDRPSPARPHVELMSSCAACYIYLSAAPTPGRRSPPRRNTRPLADNFELYVQKKTTAGALEPDSKTGGNVYMMLSIFVCVCVCVSVCVCVCVCAGVCTLLLYVEAKLF